jgi:hypothetical protein
MLEKMSEISDQNQEQAAIPAPPPGILDLIITQLEMAIDTTPAPVYVKEACAAFVEALKRWGREGQS